MRLADCNDSDLGTQDCWDEVSTTNVSQAGNTEGSISEIICSQRICIRFLSHLNQSFVDVKNTLVLHFFHNRDSKTVFGVNCDVKVMIMLDNVSLDVTLLIQVIVNQ